MKATYWLLASGCQGSCYLFGESPKEAKTSTGNYLTVLCIVVASLFSYVLPLGAADLTISAYDGGTLGRGRDGSPETAFVGPYWTSRDNNNGGPSPESDLEYNSFHKFDLSGVTQQVASAELVLYLPTGGWDNSSTGADPLVVGIYDVTEPLDSFGFDFDTGTVRPFSGAVYSDLEGGTLYASAETSNSDEDSLISFVFNSHGVDAINAASGGNIAFGGTIALGGLGSVSMFEMDPDIVFGNSGPLEQDPRFGLIGTRELRLTYVPEPGTLAMLAMGALILTCWRRRRAA
jgi:hypothetical protein